MYVVCISLSFCGRDVNIQTPEPGHLDETYRDHEADLACEDLDFFQREFNRGIIRGVVLPMPQQGPQIDPYTTWRQLAMDYTEVVYYVLRLRNVSVRKAYKGRKGVQTVSMKKQVKMASNSPA